MESDAPSDVEFEEEEDKYPIGQPKVGWESAERALHGYSKTQVSRQSKSYHKNKDDIKRRREERKALAAGIPMNQRPKPIWGKISTVHKRQLPLHLPRTRAHSDASDGFR
jgi:hypothetical protein